MPIAARLLSARLYHPIRSNRAGHFKRLGRRSRIEEPELVSFRTRQAHFGAQYAVPTPYLRYWQDEEALLSRVKYGGRTRARTWDPLIKSQLLYQLSYAPHRPEEARI